MTGRPPTERRIADGLLLVDKPAGITSHDVVAVARRALRERRIGHAGTLDPFATGLLVLLAGRATRLLPYLDGEPKVYDAVIRFGTETATDDITGAVVREAPLPAVEQVRSALPALTGTIDQVPPRYSAKKVEGARAYSRARRGQELELAPARVVVHEWRVVSLEPDRFVARIVCSGGTYIRALARDLGRAAGSAAHLESLRRVASGPFHVDQAMSMDVLRGGDVTVLPMRTAIPSLPARELDDEELHRVSHGNAIPLGVPDAARVALLDASGEVVAIAEREGETLRPRVVLHA